MRIALISAEFAGTALSGGIGTYMRNAAKMLINRGHNVEVFTAGTENTIATMLNGVCVSTVVCSNREDFAAAIAPLVVERHSIDPFDVAEGAEFMAETSEVARLLPDLPLVIKLHTPFVLIKEIDRLAIPAARKMRFMLGGFLRGQVPRPYWIYNKDEDYEFANLKTANEIVSPCGAMVKRISDIWDIDTGSVSLIPNVFTPESALLSLENQSNHNTVTYLGRLEYRKGVLDLIKIIPQVIDELPATRFRIIGRSCPHPGKNVDLKQFLIENLGAYNKNIDWINSVPYEQIPIELARTDICIFPSIWENFGYVCLEAMAAARGVVASNAGGMAEMIEHGSSGILASPNDPDGFADAILALLKSPERRMALGKAARARVLLAYSEDAIGPLQEASYRRAINSARNH